MSKNRKILNATPRTYDGIQFKSQLEVMTYRTLLQAGFQPRYEPERFPIWLGFPPSVPFLTKNSFKRKNRHIEVLTPKACIDLRPISALTYTPDFIFDYHGIHVIVECKGYVNDVFPLKFKLFRKYLESLPDASDYQLWEIFSKSQLLDCIAYLKSVA